jgi:AcrR family transcriptional regulator
MYVRWASRHIPQWLADWVVQMSEGRRGRAIRSSLPATSRRRVLDSARDLVCGCGPRAVTIGEIVSAAGVGMSSRAVGVSESSLTSKE